MIHWLFYSSRGFDVLLLLGTFLGVLIYLLPSLLSWAAGTPRLSLVIVNLLLGWTVLFWIVTFVWALGLWMNETRDEDEHPIERRREPHLG